MQSYVHTHHPFEQHYELKAVLCAPAVLGTSLANGHLGRQAPVGVVPYMNWAHVLRSQYKLGMVPCRHHSCCIPGRPRL